ncbi:MAG: UxaA family hydrolase [Proteobacteria bacterium]|nr:UxaA family hydrolase [Pseudomonadota bacterium]
MKPNAILNHLEDNVAIVLEPIKKGGDIRIRDCDVIIACTDIMSRHKVLLADLEEGASVVKYGEVIGAVLVVGLGCELINAEMMAIFLVQAGKTVEHIIIQKEGSSQKASAKGIAISKQFIEKVSLQKQVSFPVDQLVVGLDPDRPCRCRRPYYFVYNRPWQPHRPSCLPCDQDSQQHCHVSSNDQ